MKFRNPNNSKVNQRKLGLMFQRMQDRLSTKDGQNFDDAISKVYSSFKEFFTSLGRPVFRLNPLIKGNDPDPSKYNKMMEDIKHDLESAFSELDVIGDMVIDTFNVANVAAEELNNRANSASSKLVDLNLLAGNFDQEVIIAGDDFLDMSRVDQSFQIQNTLADIRINEGVATLGRVESVPVTAVDNKIVITPLTLGNGVVPTTNPTSDNTQRFYEGDFYDYIGNSRPEGGRWHLEERVNPDAVPTAQGDSDIVFQDLSDTGQIFGDAIDNRTGEARFTGTPLREEDILVIDRGASPEEKDVLRRRILDGNPDSFWECEYVANSEEIHSYVTGLDQGQIVETTPSELRARAVALDNIDLEVQVTIELNENSQVNYITLNPLNFGETTWLEVTEVSTSDSSSAGFQPIEGFDQNRFANVLTNEANEELQDDTVSDVMAPSRFSFRGTGVWTFPAREAKFIRLKLKQRIPVPDPYQRLAMQLNRTISHTETYSRGGGGGKK